MAHERGWVVVSGCSSGIGQALARALVTRGWPVIATLRRAEERAFLFADLLEHFPRSFSLYELDVTSTHQISNLAEQISTEHGNHLHALINNAGFGLFGAFEDLTEDQLRYQFEVNVFGLANLTRALLPALRQHRGRVINLSSVAGYQGLPLASAYVATKFAVEGLTESLWYELASHGVQLALVEPGGHRTNFGSNIVWGEYGTLHSSPYRADTEAFKRYLTEGLSEDGTSITTLVERIVKLVEKRRIPLRVRSGRDATSAYWLRRILPTMWYLHLSRLALRATYQRRLRIF